MAAGRPTPSSSYSTFNLRPTQRMHTRLRSIQEPATIASHHQDEKSGLGTAFRQGQPHDDVNEQQRIENEEDDTKDKGATVPFMGKPCANSSDELLIRATVVPEVFVISRGCTRSTQRRGRLRNHEDRQSVGAPDLEIHLRPLYWQGRRTTPLRGLKCIPNAIITKNDAG